MTADRRFSSEDGASFVETPRKRFFLNLLLGAIATFVLGVLSLIRIVAPVGGGAIAGYVQNTGTIDGVKVGALAGAIGGTGLNVLAPPRFFGLLGGEPGDGYYLMATFLWFAVWITTCAFGGALGARLAESRYGSAR